MVESNFPLPRLCIRCSASSTARSRTGSWLSAGSAPIFCGSRCSARAANRWAGSFACGTSPSLWDTQKFTLATTSTFSGKVDVFSGRLFDEPKLVLEPVYLGHNVVFLVSKEIVLEDDINVASGVRFMDTDAHPRDAMDRIAELSRRVRRK